MTKFVLLVIVATAIYAWRMVTPVKEVLADHSAEAMYKNQSIPVLLSNTMLYAAVLVWGYRFLLH